MATDLERLVVSLSADIKKYENSLNRAMGITNKNTRAIESRFASMNKKLSSGFDGFASSAARAFALVGGAAGAKELLDAGTRISNSLKVAGLSGKELDAVYQKLLVSAKNNAAPLETLVTLYGRASQSQKELGVNSEQLLAFTNNVALALRVAGTDATTASGSLLQLGQALGSGTVHAEEFNSIIEGTPTIAQAVAIGLKEAGGSVAKLKALVVDGAVSSEAFFRAFEAGAPVLQDKVAGATLTLDQHLTNLQTSLIDAARRFNESSEASKTFGTAIDQVAGFVNSVNFDSLIGQVTAVINAMNSGIATANSFANAIGQLSGLASVGKAIVGSLPGDTVKSYLGGGLVIKQDDLITDRINDAFTGQIEQAGKLTADAVKNSVLGGGAATTPKGGRLPESAAASVKPISIEDFKPVASSGGGGSKKKSGGGGGGGSKSADEYQREIEQIKERTVALQNETAAQAGINPLVDDYGFAVEKARAQSDLLTAAQKAGMTITPALKASIDQLATGYANASVAAEKLQASQDSVKDAADDFRNTAKDITGGFIDDLRSGSSAAEALSNALNKVLDKVIDIGLNAIFGGGGGAGGGGIFGAIGKIFGVGYADGGYTGPGGKKEPAGIVHKGEYVMDAETTKRIGVKNLRRLQGYASGGLVGAPAMPVVRSGVSASRGGKTDIQVGVSVDDTGGLRAYVKSVSNDTVAAASPRIVSAANQQVVPTMAKYQNDSAGGDYRNG